MYLEIWVDPTKREAILKELNKICDEIHEVHYDYDFIVRTSRSERDIQNLEGVKKVRKHYDC